MTHAAENASKQPAASQGTNKAESVSSIEADNIASESETHHSTTKRDAQIFSSPIIAEGLNTRIYSGPISENSLSDEGQSGEGQQYHGQQYDPHFQSHDEKLVEFFKQASLKWFDLSLLLIRFFIYWYKIFSMFYLGTCADSRG